MGQLLYSELVIVVFKVDKALGTKIGSCDGSAPWIVWIANLITTTAAWVACVVWGSFGGHLPVPLADIITASL